MGKHIRNGENEAGGGLLGFIGLVSSGGLRPRWRITLDRPWFCGLGWRFCSTNQDMPLFFYLDALPICQPKDKGFLCRPIQGPGPREKISSTKPSRPQPGPLLKDFVIHLDRLKLNLKAS